MFDGYKALVMAFAIAGVVAVFWQIVALVLEVVA